MSEEDYRLLEARDRFRESLPLPFSEEKLKCRTYEDFLQVANFNWMCDRVYRDKNGFSTGRLIPPPPGPEDWQALLNSREDIAACLEGMSSSDDEDDNARDNSEDYVSAGCSNDARSGLEGEKIGSEEEKRPSVQPGSMEEGTAPVRPARHLVDDKKLEMQENADMKEIDMEEVSVVCEGVHVKEFAKF